MTVASGTVDAVWKLESARIIAGLTRLVRDVGLAEELAQDAFVAALEQWPETGVPDNPGAWLMAVAKRRAVDQIRRSQLLERKQEQLARDLEQQPEREPDDVLRLMFISCHPVLPTPARVALTLRLIGGLTAAEIARAFLTTEPRITARIAEAKQTIAARQVPYELPSGPELSARVASVLEVVYLIFNEGYSASAGEDLVRRELCLEALRLGRLLAELAPHEPEAHGLVALMEIQASRTDARTGPDGEPVPLHEQNRARWDQLLIRRGFTAMLRARDLGGAPGPYVLQAAIAVCHAQARTAQDTDWAQIATLYASLARLLPTPVVQLNRAVAVGMAEGPRAGLDLVDSLTGDPALRDYHLLPAVRADLLAKLDRPAEARLEFERAAALTGNAAEREFLLRRAVRLAAAPSGRTLGEGAREFLARADLDAATLRSYGQTLRRLCLSLGDGLALAALSPSQVATVFTMSWDGAAARTWNRHRAAVRSFGVWADLGELTAGVDRRVETSSPPRILDVDALWARELPIREHTLWRMLHESAAGAAAVLALNVEDLDLADRRARSGRGWIGWRAQTARLLPELLAGRTRGPVFLADRRPAPARTPAEADLCPHTGRGRLSYERAEYLFKQATGHTLRRLRS
ncbi:RNA polymerase sigma factor [Catellatospora tritici]|uniref:RNA polymerase sigma factor n=1 Tax=Catellatospora tritici TaxID=2851566 RepID=UPI001C2D5999|nr:RNA polymerase sigma factor [Catellatospora tritici]MBV1850662.1 RNA polymerase sigma factor [Catellatospora tritici]